MRWKGWTAIGTVVLGLASGATIVSGAAGDVVKNTRELLSIATIPYVDGAVKTSADKIAMDLDKTNKIIQTLGNLTADTTIGDLEFRLDVARQELTQTAADAAANPSIPTLRRSLQDAQNKVDELVKNLGVARCYRAQIAAPNDTDCRKD